MNTPYDDVLNDSHKKDFLTICMVDSVAICQIKIEGSMQEGIRFSIIGSDEDLIELEINVCDGNSFFSNSVYISHEPIENLIFVLKKFKYPEYRDTYSFVFGAFGNGYAGGAIKVALKFEEIGFIFISTNLESEFETLCEEKVASQATFHLVSDEAMLVTFVAELVALESRARSDATLRASKSLGRGRGSIVVR
jgi:hypothetical protein